MVEKKTYGKYYNLKSPDQTWRDDIHTWNIADICNFFQSNITDGLSSMVAKNRLKDAGKNRFTFPKEPNLALYDYIRNCFRYFGIILFVCMVLSFALYSMEFREVNEGNINTEYVINGVILLITFLVSGYLRYLSESDEYGVALAFMDLMPMYCTVIRDSQKMIIRSESVVTGDILLINYGERIAADVRIFMANDLELNNVALTGISQPVVIIPELSHPNKWWAPNVGFAGSHVMKGRGMGIVIACGDNTEVGVMAGLSMVPRPYSRTVMLVDQVITYTHMVCIAMIFIVLYSLTIVDLPLIMMLELTIGLTMALAPQYLPILLFFGMLHIKKSLLERGCLMRNMEAAHVLGSTSVICSALIGTLTRKDWDVSEVFVEGRQLQGRLLSDREKSTQFMNLIKVSVLCNDAYQNGGQRGVPEHLKTLYGTDHDVAMLKFGSFMLPSWKKLRRDHERLMYTSFNRLDNMRASVHCVHHPNGSTDYLLITKGLVERVLRQCSTHQLNDTSPIVELQPNDRKAILKAASNLSDMGRYIFAFGYHVLSPEEFRIIANLTEDFSINNSRNFVRFLNEYDYTMQFMGFIAVYDPPYAHIDLTLERCRSAGIKLILLTRLGVRVSRAMAKLVGVIGPDSETVEDVATRLKIPTSQVNRSMVTAAVIHMPSWEKKEHHQRWDIQQLLLAHQDVVFANVAVAQRHMIVDVCQELGAVVTMVGSSVHHTSAVRRAHVGVAEEASSEACQYCADLIMIDGNFNTLVDAIAESRLFFENMRKAFAYALSSDLAMILIPMSSLLLRIPFRLFLIVSLICDFLINMLPALSLFFEPPELNVMKQKPRVFQDKLINTVLIIMVFMQVGIIEAGAIFITYFACMGSNGFLPRTLIGLRDDWYDESKNDILDSYGQEWSYDARERLDHQVSSATVFTITIMQCVNLIMTKTGRANLFKHGFRNSYLNLAVIYLIVLAIAVCFIDSPTLHIVPADTYWFFLECIWPLNVLNIFMESMRRFFIRRFPTGWLARHVYY